ncbi:hypothetical protein EUX98_g2623 [Antrodiella citrinella]|uniref:DUF6534 domain-containing protein n=1 Tax=Antrodiella citrinella TaxID=2447956 RepID=A0A4S4MZY6_9APHY|nr:hypothetical protein EUX98_g2623 [Antrodiella citrinella]
MADLPPIPPTIAQLTGPLLLGHLFNWGLFGALTVQVYIYYLSFPNDRRLSKGIVLFTYIIEVLQTVLATRDAFRNFATGWGNMIELNAVGWLWFSVPVLGSMISCLGQVFYAWRISILSRSYVVPSVIMVLSLMQFGTGLYTGAYAHLIGVFSEVQLHEYKTTIVWLGGTAICDIIIATSMMYYLYKSKTGFKQTAALISKFIRVTVETGLVCATFAILDLSLFLAFKTNNYHLAPSIALSKLYSNSLLAVFNARVRIVGGRTPADTTIMDASASTSFRALRTGQSQSTTSPQGVKVFHPKNAGGINVEISQIRNTEYDAEAQIELTDTKLARSSLEELGPEYDSTRSYPKAPNLS